MPAASPKPAAMYGISRTEQGWKVQLRRNGVALFKEFGFKIHRGEELALLRAQEWRDQMVKAHPPAPRRKGAQTLRSSNTTGIAGVACRFDAQGKPKAWIAITYVSKDTALSKFFSVGRFGAQAKELAIKERLKQLEQMTGLMNVHPAEPILRQNPERPLPRDPPTRMAEREILRSTNKSGIPGVSYRRRSDDEPGYWVAATYAGNGKYLRKSFSIGEHGDDRAKELAVVERKSQLVQLAQLSAKSKKKA